MFLDNRARIEHMLLAAQEIMDLSKGVCRAELEQDRKLSLAVVRLLEVIGEAANGVSGDFQANNPDLPWREIIAMRNRLIHGYFDINLDIVWRTIEMEIPGLIEILNQIKQDNSW